MSKENINTTADKKLKVEEKTVVVKEKQLNSILQEIETLKKTVSKQRYKEAEEDTDKEKPLTGHLKRLGGEVIIGWYPMENSGKGLCDIVYDEDGKEIKLKEEESKASMQIIYNNNIPVGEILKGHYKTIKGKDITCNAKEFYQSTQVEKFDKIEQKDNYWIVKFYNPSLPQKYKLNEKFINA